MKILIVGFDGQLGTDCTRLLREKHTLITPDLQSLNLTDEHQTLDMIRTSSPDVVINCAAYTAVDRCEEERELCGKINGEGPGFLAKGCRENNCRLIHVSTDYVFDGKKPIPQPYLEEDAVNPLSEYGRTKLAGEKAVQEQCENHVILRTAWLYSANGPNFLKTMLRITLADPQATRKVVDDQYGSLTPSHTLARQIETLLESEIRGVIHATAEGHSSWYEAACYFLEKMKINHRLVPCSTMEYPTPAHRPANSILENGVLKKNNLSKFATWQAEVDQFIDRYGPAMLQEVQQELS